jgi:hypothetical protein
MIPYRDVAAFLILHKEALTGVTEPVLFFTKETAFPISWLLRQYFRIHNIMYPWRPVRLVPKLTGALKCRGPYWTVEMKTV